MQRSISSRSAWPLLLLSFTLFVFDLGIPGGQATTGLFFVPVTLAGLSKSQRRVVGIALLCSAFVGAGYVVHDGWMFHPGAAARRAVVLATLILVAALTIRSQNSGGKRRAEAALDVTEEAISARRADGSGTPWDCAGDDIHEPLRNEAPCPPHCEEFGTEGSSDTLEDGGSLERIGIRVGGAVHRKREGRRVNVFSLETAKTGGTGQRGPSFDGMVLTKAAHLQEEIRSSDERYRRIFNTAGAAIWEEDYTAVHDLLERLRKSGVTSFGSYFQAHPEVVLEALALVRVVDVNETAVTMFQALSRDQLIQSLPAVFLPSTLPSFIVLLTALAEGVASCEAETKVQTLRGDVLTVLMSVTFPALDEPLTAVLVCLIDLTARKTAEEALAVVQDETALASRVAMLGGLTASIAQGIERPIAAIVEHGRESLRLLRAPLNDVGRVSTVLELVIEDGRRAAGIVEGIRSFVRKQPSKYEDFHLRAAVETAVSLVSRELSIHDIEVQLALEANLPLVHGDRARIEHVVVQLFVNAIRSLAELPRPDGLIVVRAFHQRGETVVQVEDNLARPDSGTLNRLFEPASPQHDGEAGEQAIGLAVCHSAIEAHGGRISTTAKGDFGVIVQFTLPDVTASSGTEPSEPAGDHYGRR